MEDEIVISNRMTPEFVQTAQAVSFYLKSLPLTTAQNDTLVALLVSHIQAAERGSFKLGLELGIEAVKEAQQ